MSNFDSTTSSGICVKDCYKSYSLGKKKIEVLKGVNIKVAPSEVVALLGASGTGKSTLLQIIGGLDTADQGNIVCGDHKLHLMKEKHLSSFRNESVGFIFQAYNLFPELTALENVCLPARIARFGAEKSRKKSAELLESVGLGHRIDHRPYEMSGGEQQRTSIARALINSPEFLLADEPTGNLDSKTGMEILNLLFEMREKYGVTLVIATHDHSLAERADRVVFMEDGKVVNLQS